MFVSTHGWARGHHRLIGGGPFMFEEHVRVPLLIRYPKEVSQARTVNRIVGTTDVAPTLLALGGVRAPATMHGRSLAPLLMAPDWRGHADERFFEYDEPGGILKVRGIVTDRYKLIDYAPDPDLCFHLKRDEKETVNIALQAEYQAVVKVLRERLDFWRKAMRDGP
jgi:arylsulfatase A-like enzyme